MDFKKYLLCFLIITLTLLLSSSVSATEIDDNSIDDLSVSDMSIENLDNGVVSDEIKDVNVVEKDNKINDISAANLEVKDIQEINNLKEGGSNIEVPEDYYMIDGEEIFEHQDELEKALADYIKEYYDDYDENPGYEYLRYVRDYLFEAEYNDFNYDFALGAYKTLFKTGLFNLSMACSTIRNGNFYGRNFDWLYCDLADFVIKSPATENRHEVIGVASSIPTLSQDFVLSGNYSFFYEILPFQLVDGINDAGLVCCINVVPTGDKEGSTIINPAIENKTEICSLILPRFILDNFDNARDAVEYIRDYVSIYQPTVIELHSLIADENETYLLEFFDGKTHVTNMTGTNRSFMTNFYLTDVVFNADGSVYTPETKTATENPVSTNNITKHGHGLERYNLINERFNDLQTEADMRALLEDLTYTHMCDNNTVSFWYSEYAHNLGIVDITLDNMNISELAPLIKAAKEK
ncbi:MAG: carcinine hydrolase/isopenicillin-N N-acyltransferase family protein [archaeon]|nr:carcinine hydrolase/isopenicillin-N N-acyltransferase family protein [archaeon]